MRKSLTLPSLVLIGLILWFSFSVLSASAATYPDPRPQSFLLNSYIYDGVFSNVTVSLMVNDNLGYVSSHKLSAPTFSSETINPHAITFSQSTSLKWNINDPLAKDVTSCTITIDSADPGNSYNNTLSGIGISSGSMSFNSSVLTPGNYTFILGCNLSNGKILNDMVYTYFIPTSVSPAPAPNAFLSNGYSSNGFNIVLKVDDNLGYNSGRQITTATFNTERMNPVAFSPSQLANSNIKMFVGYPPSWQFWQPNIKNCAFIVKKLESGSFKEIYRDDIIETPISTQNLSLPMSVVPGNYDFGITCNMSNGNIISDFVYIYEVLPLVVVPLPPTAKITTVDIKANNSNGPVSTLRGYPVVISWTATNTSPTNSTPCTDNRGRKYAATGSFTDTPTSSTNIYTMTCSGIDNNATDSVTVNISEPVLTPGLPKPSLDIKVL